MRIILLFFLFSFSLVRAQNNAGAGYQSASSIFVNDLGNVYITGHLANEETQYPIVWKDSIRQELDLPEGVNWVELDGITADDDNWAVWGNYRKSKDKLQYCYWHNGKRYDMKSDESVSILKFLQGKLYIAGTMQRFRAFMPDGFYIVDGKKIWLSAPKGADISVPVDLTLKNDTLYITGYAGGATFYNRTVLWINNVCHTMPFNHGKYYTSIPDNISFDSDNNVVIRGGMNYFGKPLPKGSKSTIWRGGFAWNLNTKQVKKYPIEFADEYKKHFKDGFYVVQFTEMQDNQYAVIRNNGIYSYWTNDTYSIPQDSSLYEEESYYINTIFLNNVNTYLCGGVTNLEGIQQAAYWINGKVVLLD